MTIYERFKKNGKWWLDNGHLYLQYYCVSEIICLIVLFTLFSEQMDFLFANYSEMSDWAFAGFSSFPAATWLMIKDVWVSINSPLHRMPPPIRNSETEDSV